MRVRLCKAKDVQVFNNVQLTTGSCALVTALLGSGRSPCPDKSQRSLLPRPVNSLASRVMPACVAMTALGRRFLKLLAPRTMVQNAKRFICSSLLVQAFLFVGHPVAASEARYVVPRDFESAAGFEVVTAPG